MLQRCTIVELQLPSPDSEEYTLSELKACSERLLSGAGFQQHSGPSLQALTNVLPASVASGLLEQLTSLSSLVVSCEKWGEEKLGPPAGPRLPPSLRHMHVTVLKGGLRSSSLAWVPQGISRFQASAYPCGLDTRWTPAAAGFHFLELQAPDEPPDLPGNWLSSSIQLIHPLALAECRTVHLSGKEVHVSLPDECFDDPAVLDAQRSQYWGGDPTNPASLDAWCTMLSPWIASSTSKLSELRVRAAVVSIGCSLPGGLLGARLRRPSFDHAPLALSAQCAGVAVACRWEGTQNAPLLLTFTRAATQKP